MKTRGIVLNIGQVENIQLQDNSTLQKVVVEVDTGTHDRPNMMAMDFIGEKAEITQRLNEGEGYQFNLNVSSRKSDDGKYFSSIRCWSVEI